MSVISVFFFIPGLFLCHREQSSLLIKVFSYLLLLTSYLYYALHRQPIAVQSEAGNDSFAARTNHRMVAELLACVYIRYMYLHDRSGERAYAVEQCHRGVGICARIQYDTVIREAHFLHLVYHLALDVVLVILYLYALESLSQFGQIALHGVVAVNPRLAFAEQVQVRSVYNKYLHII